MNVLPGSPRPALISRPLGGSLLLVAVIVAARLAVGGGLGVHGLVPGVPSPPSGVSAVRLQAQQPAPYGTGGYNLLETQSDGEAVGFDPCREIHYVLGTATAPAGVAQLLTEALVAVSRATGLRFVGDGTTTETPSFERESFQPERYGDRWAPVLIAWLPSGDPLLGPRVLGRAGPAMYEARDGSDRRFVSGLAVFDGPALQARLDTGQADLARSIVLHELGHLVGLDHVPDPYQVMYDTNLAPVSSYRDGDLRGLAYLGAGRCFTDH